MIEARIVECNENGKEVTVLFPESHDLNGPGNEKLFTNVARYLINTNLQEHFKKVLKTDFGLAMFDGASVRNSTPLLNSIASSDMPEPLNTTFKPVVCNLVTLAELALLFYPKKNMYWRITNLK